MCAVCEWRGSKKKKKPAVGFLLVVFQTLGSTKKRTILYFVIFILALYQHAEFHQLWLIVPVNVPWVGVKLGYLLSE